MDESPKVDETNNKIMVSSYSLALKLLAKKGVKVAIQCGFDGHFVYAEKKDFILLIKKLKQHYDGPTNYDGESQHFIFENNVLHVYTGDI